MNVIITSAARSDLAAIGDYIGRANPERAASFVGELLDRCEDLALMAERFQLVPRYAELGIRRRPYKGYLIFYRVTAVSVEVLHVAHGARDWQRLLFGEEAPDRGSSEPIS